MVQVPKSSVFSRRIVNLFAGMAFGSPDLPSTLKDGGYSCHSIEQSFSVGTNQVVNPEIILCSDRDEHTLVVEAKSGANLNPGQLQRYTLVSPECLEKRAFASSASAKNHDVLIIGLALWRDRLLIGSSQVPCTRRVLAVTDMKFPEAEDEHRTERKQPDEAIEGILRIENTFATERLNQAFNPVLKVNWDLIPNNFLPVDHEAADWEFAEFIMPEIIAAILNGEDVVTIDGLAETFIHHWSVINAKYRTTLLQRIRRIVKQAAQTRFSSYLRCGESEIPKNEVRLTIPDSAAKNRGSLRSQLQRRSKDFMNDLNSPQIAMVFED